MQIYICKLILQITVTYLLQITVANDSATHYYI